MRSGSLIVWWIGDTDWGGPEEITDYYRDNTVLSLKMGVTRKKEVRPRWPLVIPPLVAGVFSPTLRNTYGFSLSCNALSVNVFPFFIPPYLFYGVGDFEVATSGGIEVAIRGKIFLKAFCEYTLFLYTEFLAGIFPSAESGFGGNSRICAHIYFFSLWAD